MTVRDLEVERVYTQAVVGRELRPAERAIDVLRLDQALEQAKDDLEAATRAELVRATKAWGDGATPNVKADVTQEMLDILNRLVELGAAEAQFELERAGYVGIRPPRGQLRRYANPLAQRRYITEGAPPRRNLRDFLRRNIRAIAVRIQDEHVQADSAGVAEIAVANALLSMPGPRDLASRVISTALVDGMAQTWENNLDLVGGWAYTAILDSATCDFCAPLDGMEFATWQEAMVVMPDGGPNPECLGEGRCRCRLVPLPP